MKPRLYLDCDGVLLPSCEHTSTLLALCVERFRVMWISDREIEYPGGRIDFLEDFEKFLSPADVQLLYRIEPNPRRTLYKHERLDLSEPFLWIDDAPMGADYDFLDEHGLRDSLIIVKAWRPETMRAGIVQLREYLHQA